MGATFLGRVGTRICSDLGHRVEGGKRTTALLAVTLCCSFQYKHCSSPCALPSLLISEAHPADRRHRDQPSFGSRLSFRGGNTQWRCFSDLTAATPPAPHPVLQSVQEAENLLESTRKAQSNVWLFLKYREASLRAMDQPTEKGVCGTGRMKDDLVVNLLSPVSWHLCSFRTVECE